MLQLIQFLSYNLFFFVFYCVLCFLFLFFFRQSFNFFVCFMAYFSSLFVLCFCFFFSFCFFTVLGNFFRNIYFCSIFQAQQRPFSLCKQFLDNAAVDDFLA